MRLLNENNTWLRDKLRDGNNLSDLLTIVASDSITVVRVFLRAVNYQIASVVRNDETREANQHPKEQTWLLEGPRQGDYCRSNHCLPYRENDYHRALFLSRFLCEKEEIWLNRDEPTYNPFWTEIVEQKATGLSHVPAVGENLQRSGHSQARSRSCLRWALAVVSPCYSRLFTNWSSL